MQDVDLTQGLK